MVRGMNNKTGFVKRIIASRFFRQAKEQAVDFTENPEKLNSLLRKADEKAHTEKSGAINNVWDSLMTLVRMLRAYANGTYRNIPFKTLIAIVSSLIYFIMPFDFIPDVFFLFGFLDDAALIAWTVKSIKTDMDDFSEWESRKSRQNNLKSDIV
jgi:uncharacterized membrane protein YkvA (DUF1232 family)